MSEILDNGRYEITSSFETLRSGNLYKIKHSESGRLFLAKKLKLNHRETPLSRPVLRQFNLPSQDECFYASYLEDTAIEGDYCFLIYDCLSIHSLTSELEYTSLDFEDGLRIGVELCRGLVELHSLGIIHGRLLSDNCLMVAGRHVKLTEYGLVTLWRKIFDYELPFLDPSLKNPAKRDVQSDIYAFGILMYWAATGTFPFEINETADMQSRAPSLPAPVGKRSSGWPPEFFGVLERCATLNRSKRYNNAAVLLKDLVCLSPGPGAVSIPSEARLHLKKPQGGRRKRRDTSSSGIVFRPSHGTTGYGTRSQTFSFVIFVILVILVWFTVYDPIWKRSEHPSLIQEDDTTVTDTMPTLQSGIYHGTIFDLEETGKASKITIRQTVEGLSISLPLAECIDLPVDKDTGFFQCTGDALLSILGQRGNHIYGFVKLHGTRFHWNAAPE